MSGSACSSACGWCGGCTAAWERDATATVSCVICDRHMVVEADERPPYRCDACAARSDLFSEGDVVVVLQAARLPREVALGTGRIARVTTDAQGTRVYWITGFPVARPAHVLRRGAVA